MKTASREKKYITHIFYRFNSLDEFSGPLDGLSSLLSDYENKILEEHSEATNIRIEFEVDDYYNSFYDKTAYDVFITYDLLESDEVFNKRIATLDRAAKKREAARKKKEQRKAMEKSKEMKKLYALADKLGVEVIKKTP